MRALKSMSVNLTDFQKCGEIMVAVKKNKFAMACNFCQEMFSQLQSFMRHLQLQHNDKLEFTKEMEVYAVEELMNQTVVSCESEEVGLVEYTQCLKEDDINWLQYGTESKKREDGENVNKTGEISGEFVNTSILKALEDCDVSLNFIDNLVTAKNVEGGEENSKLGNDLLGDIQGDLCNSDAIGKVTYNNMTEIENISKNLVDKTKGKVGSITMSEMPITCKGNEDNFEKSIKGIKNLLGCLENLEDVDNLLKNLNYNIPPENNLINEGKAELKHKNHKNKESKTTKTEFVNGVTNTKSESTASCILNISNILNIPDKDLKNKEMQHNSSLETTKQNLLTHNNPICKEAEFSSLNSTLDEDLTTVLANVLENNEMDLLNIQQKDEVETPLNQELLNYLDQELMEYENESTLNLIKDTNKPHTVQHSLKSTKKSRSSLMSANIKMKYQKTHLKAKSKLSGIRKKILLKTPKQMLSKNSKLILIENAQNYVQKNKHCPFKVFLHQKQSKCADEVLQRLDANQTDSILNQENLRHGKIPNQESNTPTVNINKFKEDILTPNLSLINSKRRKKISLKKEQSPRTEEISEDIFKNIMLKQGRESSNEIYVKPSLEGLKKKENFNSQQTTLRIGTQGTCTKLTKLFKESFETREKIQPENHSNKKPKTSLPNYLSIQKDSKMQSPVQNKVEKNESSCTQNFTKSNKLSSSLLPQKITVGNSTSNCHPMRFPSTTPQRMRNVTIKLSRVKSNKLIQKIRPQKAETLKQSNLYTSSDNTKSNISHIGSNFKLPKGIVITRILPNTNISEKNAAKVDETSIKSCCYKQNFTESNLDASQYEILSNKKAKDIQESFKLQSQNEVLNNLKSESISYKLRQRKASIDTLPNSIEAIKTPRHYNMNYKSYAVSRSVRKKEVSQRMRRIKNQILKSIENGECTITKFSQAKSPLRIKNVQILPNLNTSTIPLNNPFKDFKNSTAATKKLNDGKASENSNNDFPINLNEKLVKKLLRSTTAMLNDENQAKRPFKPLRKIKYELIGKTSDLELTQNKLQIKSPLKECNKLDQKSSKLILYRANQNNKSPQKEKQNEMLQKNSGLKATRLDLSENVVNFLQCDLKANRLNVKSSLGEGLSIGNNVPDETSLKSNANDTKNEYDHKDDDCRNNINLIDDQLQQVDNEKNIINTSKTKDESSKSTSTFKDFNETKDIKLLNHFGLKIIKVPNIEDIISLEEFDVMHEKAQKFANIYKCFQKIWSTKYFPEISTNKKDLETSFDQLLSQTNIAFDISLNLVEIKRLVNLINMWYGHNFNSKLIEKKKISESANRYLLMFNYIPKTVRRSYFCEYCKEYFNTEHKYFTHRIKHTGASYPYICQKCFLGYKVFKSLKLHENVCNMNESVKNIKHESTNNNYDNTNFITKIRVFQCLVCSETFETSKLLYEHSKKHLKTVYNCVKCDLVFASAIDVRNHMTICNEGTKHVPRSTKQKKN